MAVVRPFLGLRYQEGAGMLDQLIAPPHSSLTQSERDEYAVRSDFNAVHVTFPEGKVDDRSKYIRYARSSASLADWRRSGVLAADPVPCYYRLLQSDSAVRSGHRSARTALICLVRLDPETRRLQMVASRRREDRLRLLEAANAHLEPTLVVAQDPGGTLYDLLQQAPGDLAVEATSDSGSFHRMEPISDPSAIAALTEELSDKRLLVADDAATYEAALSHQENVFRRGDGDMAEDFILAAIVSSEDPDLRAVPQHRILSRMPVNTEQAMDLLRGAFLVEEHHSSRLMSALGELAGRGVSALGVAFEGGRGVLLTAKSDSDSPGKSPAFDSGMLHQVILSRMLGVTAQETISTHSDPNHAIRAVEQGAAASFLLAPLDTKSLINQALKEQATYTGLPAQSVSFFPRIPSGLVYWSLKDYS